VQKNPLNKDNFTYQHPFVKLIVFYELRKVNHTYQEFLNKNGFQEEINEEVNPEIPGNLEGHGNLEIHETLEI